MSKAKQREQAQQAPEESARAEQAVSEDLDTYGMNVLETDDGNVIRNLDMPSLKPNLAPDQLRCNFSTSDFRGRAMIVAATSPGTVKLDENGTARIKARYWATFPDRSFNEDTGEVITGIRTVLLSKDGETFRTWSDAIGAKISDIFDLFSKEEVEAGIPFLITHRRSRRPGRMYYNLTVEIPDGERG